MREYVVRMRGFFDPVRIHACEFFARDDCGWQRPLLIRVEHDGRLRSHNLSETLSPLQVTLESASNF